MFGYVTANEPELKMKEYHEYRAFYCGLCNVLRDRYGFIGQMTLTYDMTFLVILLTSLYECVPRVKEQRCKSHPIHKQRMLLNSFTEYAADMNILLTYHHLVDDWQDEKSPAGFAGAGLLIPAYEHLKKQYPKKSRRIRFWLHQLQKLEMHNEQDIDRVSGCFGRILETLFVWQDDIWKESLGRMGFYLGKFIYLLDAFDDIEEDMKNGSFNVLKSRYCHENFTDECNLLLNMMMAECTIEFEKLPCLLDAEILRNILYSGVWKKFNQKMQKDESYGRHQGD